MVPKKPATFKASFCIVKTCENRGDNWGTSNRQLFTPERFAEMEQLVPKNHRLTSWM